MEQFRLIRGEDVLGVVTLTPDERVDGAAWDVGRLEPVAGFETARGLFEDEQRLFEWAMRCEADPDTQAGARRSAWLLDLAAGLQSEIMRPGVWLVALSDGRREQVDELHVEARKVFWR
jgi:hypothetical protein